MNEKGNGQIKLHPQARIIVLTKCPHCSKLEHSCICGLRHKRPSV